MPFVVTDGVRHYYRMTGTAGRPVVMLSHSLGLDHGMWDPQAVDLERAFPGAALRPSRTRRQRCPGRRIQHRAARPRRAGIADALGVQTFAFCGLVDRRDDRPVDRGATRAERLTHLVLANTTSRMADPAAMEARRQDRARRGHARRSPTRRCGGSSRRPPLPLTRRRSCGRGACCSQPIPSAMPAAARQSAISTRRPRWRRIRTPTLVISGDLDESMPWDGHGRVLAESHSGRAGRPPARGARLESGAAAIVHRRAVRFPAAESRGDGRGRLADSARGARRRPRRSQHRLGHRLHREFQELITRFAWGTIWARPGLDHRTRRLLIVAITAALEPLGGIPAARPRRPRRTSSNRAT